MALLAEGITALTGTCPIINDVSLELHAGELLAVVGPNGAGKSTLIKSLSGEWPLTKGNVTLDGKNLERLPSLERARRLAVLPQQSQLNFNFSVNEVVQLGRYPHSSGQSIDKQILKQVMKAVDIEYLHARSFPTLSGGEKQRVQLARVLAQIWRNDEDTDGAPCYVLLDEPTAALDMAHQQLLLQVAKQLTDRGVGVLAILHDLNLTTQYADQVMIMHMGKKVVRGPASEVITSEQVKEVFQVDVEIIEHPKTNTPVILYGGE